MARKKGKKQRNLKHAESIRRKREVENKLEEIGLSIDDDFVSIAVVFYELSLSQKTFYALNRINLVSSEFSGINFSIFVQSTIHPCIPPKCAIFDIKHLIGWRGPIITTDTSTTIDALRSESNNIVYYVFDLDFIHKTNFSLENIQDAFNNNRVTVVARCRDHADVIEKEFGCKVVAIVQDFGMKSLTKIALEKEKCQNRYVKE
jgi:hypothetical protein